MIVIADSSGLISAFVATDRNHQLAVAIKRELEKLFATIYIPTEIFAETINVVGKKLNHKAATKLGETLLSTKSFLIPTTPDEVRVLALKRFNKIPFSVSFTDCLVMAFADEFETKEIFGFDEAFVKNGYKRLGLDK